MTFCTGHMGNVFAIWAGAWMPWKVSSAVEAPLRFVARLIEGEAMTDLCQEFGVSRKTGYKIFNRYKEEGIQALDDLTGREAADIISRGMDSIEQEMLSTWRHEQAGQPEFLAKYDAPNGWGSTIGAVIFLARLMDACRRHPRKRLEVD